MYTVYKHTAPNGKIYIGITSQTPKERWRNGNGYQRCQAFKKAINKYGWENIKHEILFENLTKEAAEEKERSEIIKTRSNEKQFGYNIQSGGNAKGKHSEETRKKISNANKGKIVTKQTREKMSKNHADVRKEKNPWYKKHPNEATREKMRAAQTGKQTGEKNPMFGKRHTEEAKLKQSENRKGKAKGKDNPKARAISQYSIYGEKIKDYSCISEAENELSLCRGGGGHISACAKGKLKQAYGFIWKYREA